MKENDALVLVHLRNAFYRKKYHFVLGVYFLSLIVIIFLMSMLVYLVRNPPHPLYFAADNAGRLIQDIPLDMPNMSTDNVAAWAIEAVQAAYSYDFVNYRAELQDTQKYFTGYGWQNYMQGLKTSNNLVALTERKYIIIAKVVDQPKLIIEGILSGAYAWKFEMAVLATYLSPPYDDKSQFQNALSVTVVVQRQKTLQSYKGLGIIQLIGTLVYSPSQNIAAPPPS